MMVMHNDIYADNNAVLPRLLTGPIKSAHALITRDIAMRILRGEYPPGSLLPPESDLIDQYTVSRTALREAIKTLSAKGLLVSKTKIGTRVLNESYWNLYDPQVLSSGRVAAHPAQYRAHAIRAQSDGQAPSYPKDLCRA